MGMDGCMDLWSYKDAGVWRVDIRVEACGCILGLVGALFLVIRRYIGT